MPVSRTPIVAGNWKMNKTRPEAKALATAVAELLGQQDGVETVLCPPFTELGTVADAIAGRKIHLGAQNCHHEDSGAFTGEVSVPMLAAAGCRFVIIGHSERRQFFHETDEGVNVKAKSIIRHGLTPILCVGELLAERESGKTLDVVRTQVSGGLKDLTAAQVAALVLAYEPVWAIGTGKTATPDQAQEVHAAIRKLVAELYDNGTAAAVRIQYGGSVKPDNAKELLGQPDIDGALVGGACLEANGFASIVRAAVS